MTTPAAVRRLPRSVEPIAGPIVERVTEALTEGPIACAWIPAPRVTAAAAFQQAATGQRFAWVTPLGDSAVGSDIAQEISAAGPRRFERVKHRLLEVGPTIAIRGLDGARPLHPRWYGGFAFSTSSASVSGFGEARLVLPRFEFRHDGRQGQMALFAMREDADTGELEQLVGRLLDWRARAQSELPPLPPPPRLVDRAAGAGLRDRILAAIESITKDRMAKVVVAQTEHLLLDPAPDAAVTLRRLHGGSPSATAFAFDTEAGCFLGASPERLVLRDQQHVVSEALAGSARWSSESDATALLRSAKDQSEHAFVVESIVQALEPLCTELRAPTSPVLRTLEHVAHLSTPIEGRLATAVHVLDLVERLHPTPAVGGSPTQAALEWIAAHEPHPRGWYSGPVGWADTAGNGDFVVALRSGHLQGHTAVLHAGAGVVRDSVAEAELAEIDLKLESFRAALGVGTR